MTVPPEQLRAQLLALQDTALGVLRQVQALLLAVEGPPPAVKPREDDLPPGTSFVGDGFRGDPNKFVAVRPTVPREGAST